MRLAIIFGGAGYIGTNLLSTFLKKEIFDKYYIFDINPLRGFEKEVEENIIELQILDVRNKIQTAIKDIDKKNSWIFNLAAVHREPGHKFHEYFDTNVPGAKNINDFARKTGIKNIFFTSSIAPYGRSSDVRVEESPLYPETAYGISKALAEKIHQQWSAEDEKRRLIIVRPSVIFGPKDPGNVYRMIKAIKKGTFVLPDGGNIIKGYGYIYGLIDSIFFTMNKQNKLIIYNYAENPLIPLKEMVRIVKKELKYKRPTIKLSVNMLTLLGFFVQKGFKLIGKDSDIHPIRIKKASFSTNVKPQYLIDNGFEFKYDFENALKHWRRKSPTDFE